MRIRGRHADATFSGGIEPGTDRYLRLPGSFAMHWSRIAAIACSTLRVACPGLHPAIPQTVHTARVAAIRWPGSMMRVVHDELDHDRHGIAIEVVRHARSTLVGSHCRRHAGSRSSGGSVPRAGT